jgi:hypothetical protein
LKSPWILLAEIACWLQAVFSKGTGKSAVAGYADSAEKEQAVLGLQR